MWSAVTEPKSLPSSPARAAIVTEPDEISLEAIASYSPFCWDKRALCAARERLGVLDHPLLGLDRQAPRDQVVARVAVGNLDDVAGDTELVDGLLEDDLHRDEYGSRAISRAFLTADATSRWCWTQLPVTRRARIFPRSDMNLRSVTMSL